MKVPYTAAHGAIRFSFSRENNDEDVDRVLEVMPRVVEKLRALSPFWKDGAKASFEPTYA
jgi:cysteine desulfurase